MPRGRKPISLLWRMALVFCCFFCASRGAAWGKEHVEVLHDFREIPGVTREEIQAIEALQKKDAGLTYGMLMTTETFVREDGSVGGYSALFCDWISELFGMRIEPRIYDWNELITGFESGKIDFTGELTSTPERLKKYIMTDTFTERAIKAFRLVKSERLSEIAKTRKLRYLFLEGTTTIDSVISASEYAVEPVLVSTEEEAIEKLRTGQADAFMAEEHGAAIFPDDIAGENIFPVIYSPISFSTARSELEPIVRVFDKYLANGAFFHLIDLYNEGNEEYLRYKLFSRLSSEEKEYLAAHQAGKTPIPVAAESDSYPSCFYNKREGQWQGIAVDVMARIESLSGLDFRIENQPGDNWAKLFEKFERGEAAMITELIYSKDRKGRFLWALTPYSVDYFALLSLAEHEDIGINQVLYSKIGLVAESAYADVFREWFPDHRGTREYGSSEEGFEALEKKEIDFLMASRNVLLSATNYHENPGYKANLVFDRTYESSFGFHKDQRILCSIVSKAQSLVDTRTIADRWTRKVFDYRSKMAQAQIPYLLGTSGLLVCVLALVLVLFVRSRQMKKRLEVTVRERTAELEVQTEAARVASQAKGDFLSRMSHEIRTPLNAIVGMAQIARQTAVQEGSRTLEPVGEIIAASSHLLGILNDVLDMSKIESGKFSLAHEAFCLRDAMEDVSHIIAPRCNEKQIAFAADLDAADIAVAGDRLRLKQVLINLLGNAVKFTDPGGRVELAVAVVSEGDSEVALRFSVRDNGIGMTDEQMSRLFDAFEQADSTTASRYGGTGLGLTISQNLVKQMGGEIVVSSRPQDGSTFAFTLVFPRAGDALFVQEAEREVSDLDLSDRRILLVEDIAVNRMIVVSLLQETGVCIEEAESGEEAVALFEKSAVGYYDLIFMDIQMPGIDGHEAARRIRGLARADANSVRIIAMTANAYREDIDKALAAGMNGHLSKPIDIDAVKRLLAEELPSR